ncbi:protein-L-isoaspartate(D-aspartate) O-methyltransferase [Chitinispirillales bacterium ANBcel5]|uniref:protein-L-isoaspartate(D-aspartate) O-methyltransferase n=1 Tax=Cellulosispirillum alkaliphilum TaxID=3039283 RepID=UPI002A4F2FA9|nr:protein-L-isoaspartate(D-aspartate) O-methyltransferase [Chitinispirillales bacterium ANBcel5]
MSINHIKPEIACERLIRKLREKGIKNEKVLQAFRSVPRHLFVDGAMYAQAYDDNALPIGTGQTISQPFVVALMTELLDLGKDDKILEIGTGSGFQSAILAQFSRRVYTIERHRDLAEAARKRLREQGYANVVIKVGDGSNGWPQFGPFDRIIVTAGAPVTPATLQTQLAVGGLMVVPTGDRQKQELLVYKKTPQGFETHSAGSVVFVPLVGQHGWK